MLLGHGNQNILVAEKKRNDEKKVEEEKILSGTDEIPQVNLTDLLAEVNNRAQ